MEEIFNAEFDLRVGGRWLHIVTMHPHVIGHRSRIALLARHIAHIKAKGQVWFATHEQVARYCLEAAKAG